MAIYLITLMLKELYYLKAFVFGTFAIWLLTIGIIFNVLTSILF